MKVLITSEFIPAVILSPANAKNVIAGLIRGEIEFSCSYKDDDFELPETQDKMRSFKDLDDYEIKMLDSAPNRKKTCEILNVRYNTVKEAVRHGKLSATRTRSPAKKKTSTN